MGAPKIQTPTPGPSPSQTVSPIVQGIQNTSTQAARLAGGFGSTILNTPQGGQQSTANAAKTLLGG